MCFWGVLYFEGRGALEQFGSRWWSTFGPLCSEKRRNPWMGHAHSEVRFMEEKSLIRNSLCIHAQESFNPINSKNPTHRNACCGDEKISDCHSPLCHHSAIIYSHVFCVCYYSYFIFVFLLNCVGITSGPGRLGASFAQVVGFHDALHKGLYFLSCNWNWQICWYKWDILHLSQCETEVRARLN